MITRRIALSLISIVSAFAIMGGATFAFFSDTGTSSSNTFATGTLNLKLSDSAVNGGSAETDQDSVTASFGSNTLVPGSCTGDQTLTLKNTGTVAANHAEVSLANVVTDANNNATPDMDSFLSINKLTYGGIDITSQITDINSNGFKDLADWAAGSGLDNLSLTDLNTGHDLVLDTCLNSTAGNTIQGDSVSSTFTVDLNQDASQ